MIILQVVLRQDEFQLRQNRDFQHPQNDYEDGTMLTESKLVQQKMRILCSYSEYPGNEVDRCNAQLLNFLLSLADNFLRGSP